MSQTDFELIRKVAADRAVVFVPEYQLVQKLKKAPTEKKSINRLPEDSFRDALTKLFSSNDDEMADLSEAVKFVRNLEFLDPRVLAVAAKYYRRYPAGLNTMGSNNPRALSQAETLSDEMTYYAKEIMQLQGIQGIDELARIKADIITYYFMIIDSGV